ncbi:exonuclease subunit SbcD [Psychromonas antarctica]|jgi:exonuclease SbcD|uniref:exonuclease subunit SbcD n=1 Tax=Psychromonas antarctica TaxID=67573 RepID=UPI001EE8270B|nr:exonuclease subunit SbcD [Psychromonas antarctica]MCG6202282.1 exonuclease subunit SbcD [Psychromonas antarctica]
MKILHTSDWHLGQYFMMKTRESEHLQFLNWLIEEVNRQKIDLLIVAGDIFDSASPPSYARKLYSDFIVRLQQSVCQQLIIVSGNHDSVAVLNENKDLLKALNVSLLAGLSDDLSDHLITIKDDQKNVQGIVCALPFLRVADVLKSDQGSSAADKQMNLQQGIAATYQSIFELAEAQRNGQSIPVIATGHLTAVGCSVSDSVREIYIGSLTAFPASLFPAFNYIALGHLHRPQKVQKSDHIRYSGSPIALSFDETAQQKKVNVIEFNPSLAATVSEINIPEFQKMRIIHGDLTSISTQIETLLSEFKGQSIWLEIKLKQNFYLSDVQTELNALVAGSNIEILKISSPKIDENNQWQADQKSTLDNLTPTDLFQHRLEIEDSISELQKTQLSELFAQVCAEVEDKL